MRKRIVTEEELLVTKIKEDINQSGLHIVEILERDGKPHIITIRYETKIDLAKHAVISGNGYMLTAKSANDTRKEIKYFIKKVAIDMPEKADDVAQEKPEKKQVEKEKTAEDGSESKDFAEIKEEIKDKVKRKSKEVKDGSN